MFKKIGCSIMGNLTIYKDKNNKIIRTGDKAIMYDYEGIKKTKGMIINTYCGDKVESNKRICFVPNGGQKITWVVVLHKEWVATDLEIV